MAEGSSPEWAQTLVTLLGGGVIASTIQALFTRRKTAAEARKIDVEADSHIQEIVNARVEILLKNYQALLDSYRADLSTAYVKIERLEHEIIELRQALDKRPPPSPSPFGI